MMTRNLFYVAAASLMLGLALMFGQARPALAHGGFAAKAYSPYKSGKSVVSTGRMWVYGWHAAARIEVVAKRKVCGFWGCSYETKATKSKTINQGDTGFVDAYQPCVAGTHRYMTRVDYTIVEPFYSHSGSTYGEQTPEFRCG